VLHIGIETRRVGADQDRRGVREQGPLERARHARTEIAIALIGERQARCRRPGAEPRVAGVGRATQLHRSEHGALRGQQRLRQRVRQQSVCERGRAVGTERRDQAGLRQPRHRRLGHHDDAARRAHR
jgi:hypothetical protein